MRARTRLILARGGLVLFSTLLALGGAEGIYRMASRNGGGQAGDDDWYERYRRMNESIYMRSSIDGLVYEPRPSSAVEMEYGLAGFDAERRRSQESAPDPLGERVDVAMLGDSLVWSEYVAARDSLPQQTELALGAERYRVSNFGVSGYGTAEEAIYYEHRVRPHTPDVVVVVFCMNDLFIASGPFGRFATDQERALKDAQDEMFDTVARVRRETLDGVAQSEEAEATFKLVARLHAMWRRRTFADHYVDEYTIAASDEARLARVRTSLARLGAAIETDGADAVLVISPMLEAWDHYHWAPIHEAVREAAEAAGFTVHDPLPTWRTSEHPDDLRSPGDNLHYSAHGNAVFGRFVADALH